MNEFTPQAYLVVIALLGLFLVVFALRWFLTTKGVSTSIIDNII